MERIEQVEPPFTPQQGYNLTADIANDAIRWLHAQDGIAPNKPFFLYSAPGAVHTPLQVSKQWIDKYKGRFDQGWDKLREETFARQKTLGVIPANAELTPRPDGLPAWDSLPPDQQKLLAHQAEVDAGFAEQADYEVGRVLQAIHDEGKSDNTLVFEIFGDNHMQYFATSGNRAIYKDGWWAGDRYSYTWEPRGAFTLGPHTDLDRHPWELYNLNDDYSQAHDLAARYPEKLKELQKLFDEEATRNHVYPLIPTLSQQASPFNGRQVFVFRDGVERIPNCVGPQLVGRHHQIAADLEIPAAGAEGVVLAQGSHYGGFTLYVKDNHAIYEVNAYGKLPGRIVSEAPLLPGAAHIELEVVPDAAAPGGGESTILGPRGVRPGTVLLSVN